MSDRVDANGEMLSKNIALSIANETEMETSEEHLAPLVDACHRFLEGGVDEDLLHDVLLELTHEMLRSDMRKETFEDVDDDEDTLEPVKSNRGNLFDRGPFDDVDEE